MIPTPPETEEELLRRGRAIAGHTLGRLAEKLGRTLPDDLTRAKGFVGQLVEAALGATASNRPLPDFEVLGVELKTIPIDRLGRPRESTFVCTIVLTELSRVSWEQSLLRMKLARVLWVPVEADPSIGLASRKVGNSVLWSPDAEEDRALSQDFDELAELIATGHADTITAHRGRYLQVRPKAASSRERTWGVDDEGARVRTLPRGFYLRRSFTAEILRKHFS